jgi:hypothetical protein
MGKAKDVNLIVKKANDAMRAVGRAIVATEARAESTVRDTLIACKGYSPEQLEHVKEGVQEAYKSKLDTLYEKAAHDLPDNFSNIKQAIYNRRSEKLAILDAFRLYAGMDHGELTLFDAEVDKAQSYHALVAICRATVQVSKGETGSAPKVVSQHVSAKGFSVTLQRVERMDATQLGKLLAKVQSAMKKFAAPAANVYNIAQQRKARKQAEATAAMRQPKKKARKAA